MPASAAAARPAAQMLTDPARADDYRRPLLAQFEASRRDAPAQRQHRLPPAPRQRHGRAGAASARIPRRAAGRRQLAPYRPLTHAP